MHYLDESIWFPDPSEADDDGLLALGGDLSSERLILAYQSGIFPWFEEGQPILWWSPDPRMVLFLYQFNVSKSLDKTIQKKKFRVSFNTAFSEVIKKCSTVKRTNQQGTWITNSMQSAYQKLHKEGLTLSVEVWIDTELVGGMYGVILQKKKIFCGESMFSEVTDASKVGLYYLVEYLKQNQYSLIDCQMYTNHLASLGAVEISRSQFLSHL